MNEVYFLFLKPFFFGLFGYKECIVFVSSLFADNLPVLSRYLQKPVPTFFSFFFLVPTPPLVWRFMGVCVCVITHNSAYPSVVDTCHYVLCVCVCVCSFVFCVQSRGYCCQHNTCESAFLLILVLFSSQFTIPLILLFV